MRHRVNSFDLGSAAAAAVVAPALSVLITFTIAAVVAVFSGGFGEMPILAAIAAAFFLAVVVTAWGLVPSLAFGIGGAWLAGRVLARRPLWTWGLAGAATAGLYVLVSVGLAWIKSPATFLIAPWAVMLELSKSNPSETDPAEPVVVTAILLAGLAAGLIYRSLLDRTGVTWKTYSPLAAIETSAPDETNGADKSV